MPDEESPDYAELHCHSAFSLLDGASTPEALVERARALRLPALALTDHDDLGGVVRFAGAAAMAGVAGIVGVELTVEVPGCGIRNAGREANVILRKRARRATEGSRMLTPDPSVASLLQNDREDAALAQDDSIAPVSRIPYPVSLSHLVLLAESRQGYANLASLVTRARMDAPRGHPSVSLDVLARHTDGLFALTGCPRGWVPSLAAAGDLAGARAAAGTLHDMFGGRLAIECWDHGLAEERETVQRLRPIAQAVGVPWVVTNDVHYARVSQRIVHDVLHAIRHERPLDAMGTRLRPSGEWHLKSAAQMWRRWAHAPEGLRTSVAIAERCAFRLEQLEPTLPAFPLPPGVGADEYLARLVEQGAHERWGATRTPAHERQIAHELELIRTLGLAGYFLIVWDIVRFAQREGILCQGRGSAANSAVCFCLGITAVDPIRLGLLFERFLSPERREAPDIDIDFAHRDRERVLQYVYERYGREHAAMVCEQITYRGRSAVRDAARALGFSLEQADALSLLSDRFSARATAARLRTATANLPDEESEEEAEARAHVLGQRMIQGTEATTRSREVTHEARKVGESAATPPPVPARQSRMKNPLGPTPLAKSDRPLPNAAYEPYGSPAARQSGGERARRGATTPPASGSSPLEQAGLDPADPRVRALADVVEGMHDLPRHRSIHVGGFVLTAEPLSTVVPIEPASMPGRTVIQWEKDDLDPVGLVKIDLLGLGMLTVLQDCLKYVRATRGVTIDIGTLEMTDQAVYDDLSRADTIGVFQVESRAQMNTLPRLKPRCFYDLVVEVALIRPGPIQGEMVHPYLRRRAGEEPVTYPHPSLEPILARTLGVPLFQEQGMQVAITAAGFSAGEADTLRRAMGHKRSRERMADICRRMIDGMRANGFDEATATRVYNQINAFADYGFPESHAASFALLVYASAYLRHYYTPEFTAALLNAQPMGFYAPGTIIEDARRHGVVVRPVDLMKSGWDATLEREKGDGRGETTAHRSPPGELASRLPSPVSRPPASRPPALRLGLRSIRGLGAAARDRLEQALAEGPFTSVADVVRRTGLDRRALRHLAEAGAFDSMIPDAPAAERRRAALWKVLDAARGDAGPLAPAPPPAEPTALPPMLPAELTEADYRMTGISLVGHPMKHLRELLRPNGILSARQAQNGRDRARVAVAGLVICRQRPGTAKGFVFLTLEDETGLVNVVVTPKRFRNQALLISTSALLLIRGTLQVEGRVVNVRGESFRALDANVGAEWARRHDFH